MEYIEIVKKAKNGDDEAFSKLIKLYKEKLYRIAYAYLKDEQNSLDAVSETIYKAYMNISKVKIPEYFNTWIVRILINTCKNILKNTNKIIYIDEYDKVNEDSTSISFTEFNIESNVDLYNAIDNLNEKYKSVIILKYFEDMTITQISEILDSPEGTIKVYLRRAIGMLKVKLNEECV